MKKATELHTDLIRRKHKYVTVPRWAGWLLAGVYLIAFGYLLGMYGRWPV